MNNAQVNNGNSNTESRGLQFKRSSTAVRFSNGASVEKKFGRAILAVTDPEGNTLEVPGQLHSHHANKTPIISFFDSEGQRWKQSYGNGGSVILTRYEGPNKRLSLKATVSKCGEVIGTDRWGSSFTGKTDGKKVSLNHSAAPVVTLPVPTACSIC